MHRRFFLSTLSGGFGFALGGGLLVGCGLGQRTVVDLMREKGYVLDEATHDGRTGHVVRGIGDVTYAAAGDTSLANGTKVVLIYKDGILIPDFLDDVYAPVGTRIQPVVVSYDRALSIIT